MINEFSKKEAPIQGIAGLGGGVSSRLLTIASGAITYIDEVFSTFLYKGNSSARSITNGIDLDGEGGMVWIKSRDGNLDNNLFDTERGAGRYLASNGSAGEVLNTTRLSSFNSNGFSLGDDPITNSSGSNGDLCSWTFRKCPGFFDVVTYNGNSTNRQIAHNLGSVPGMIIIKALNKSSLWRCYHRGLSSADYVINLNQTSGEADSGDDFWNSTHPTASVFTLGDQGNVNETGSSYVAYLFAHNDGSFGESSNEAVIKCGSFTGANHTESLGFEPQWLLAKRTDANGDWFLVDNMRGFYPQGRDSVNLRPNENNDENTAWFHLTSDGFYYSSSSASYIYMAIRRPHKPPTAATEVFALTTRNGNQTADTFSTAGFPVDLAIISARNVAHWTSVFDRLRGPLRFLATQVNNAEASYNNTLTGFDSNTAIEIGTDSSNLGVNRNSQTYVDFLFKRAPGFFDAVTYAGTGSNKTESHNLSVIPEMIIVKKRSSTAQWAVYHSATGNTGITQFTTGETYTPRPNYWNSTTPTSTQFSLGSEHDVNDPSDTFIAYLFATLPGISKVGSYTSDGNARNVDCGFTGGARFVLIKKSSGTGDWYLFDTARGIASGNDPYLLINGTAAEVTNTDYIDPLNSGFALPASTAVNTNGSTYIFLAIA